jgi:hypothetical protein
MSEQPISQKPERIPCDYTEEDLKKDVLEWAGSPVASRKEEMTTQPFWRQFTSYQNNFWTAIVSIKKYLSEDGLIDENKIASNWRIQKGGPQWSHLLAVTGRIIENSHLVEIFNVIKGMGMDPMEISDVIHSPLNEDQVGILIKIWIGMRKSGFNRMDLIG